MNSPEKPSSAEQNQNVPVRIERKELRQDEGDLLEAIIADIESRGLDKATVLLTAYAYLNDDVRYSTFAYTLQEYAEALERSDPAILDLISGWDRSTSVPDSIDDLDLDPDAYIDAYLERLSEDDKDEAKITTAYIDVYDGNLLEEGDIPYYYHARQDKSVQSTRLMTYDVSPWL